MTQEYILQKRAGLIEAIRDALWPGEPVPDYIHHETLREITDQLKKRHKDITLHTILNYKPENMDAMQEARYKKWREALTKKYGTPPLHPKEVDKLNGGGIFETPGRRGTYINDIASKLNRDSYPEIKEIPIIEIRRKGEKSKHYHADSIKDEFDHYPEKHAKIKAQEMFEKGITDIKGLHLNEKTINERIAKHKSDIKQAKHRRWRNLGIGLGAAGLYGGYKMYQKNKKQENINNTNQPNGLASIR